MKLRRFSAIVDAYGSRAEYWPEAERFAAVELSRSSIEAARILADARRLDGALTRSALGQVHVDAAGLDALRNRICRAAAQPATVGWFGRWFGFDITPSQLWPSVAGLALATVLGFGVGIGGLLQGESSRDADDVAALSSIDLPAAGP